ncbi:MAG TPA: type II secretion system protein [Usitatibacter sp.]|nr:type II secretion system protein [Usitatibacter sp.]
MRTRPRREDGFTLIEVVVAFVLLGLVLSTGFEIFSEGMTRAAALDERSRALEVARSHLEDAGAEEPVKPAIAQGEAQDPRFHWTTAITPSTEGIDPAHPIPSAYALYRIEVKVDWRGGDGKDHSFSLATLRLGSRQ